MKQIDKEPTSDLSRYAYGYSDKKPRWTFWVFPAIAVVYLMLVITGVIQP